MTGLRERSFIVTGGGTGIGAACAEQLVRDGAVVTICGRTASTLEATVDRLEQSAPGRIGHVVADVTDEADVARVVARATELGGALHGVVANAGGGGGIGAYHLQEVDEFVRVLHLNVIGTLLLVKHAVPHMVAAGGGSFVGMSSIAGELTHRYFGAYTVSKAGVEEMMRNAADEYGEVNVRFNAVRPGLISTDLTEAIRGTPAVFESYDANMPMEGVGTPADVANLVRFLLGPESRWITGQIINVDGGHSLRRGPDVSAFAEPMFGGRDVLLARQPAPTSP